MGVGREDASILTRTILRLLDEAQVPDFRGVSIEEQVPGSLALLEMVEALFN